MENRTGAVTFAILTVLLLVSGCVSRSGNKTESNKTDLPAISADNTPFVRITELAYIELRVAAMNGRPTSTRGLIEDVIKRQRVFGTDTLAKGAHYIPALMDDKEPGSILTVDSGVEEWALVLTAVWDESRNKWVVLPGFIPLYEYKQHLASLRKAKKKK